MIVPMAKVQIVGLKSQRRELVSCLHRLGVLHIELAPLSKILEQHGLNRVALEDEDEKERLTLEGLIKKVDEILLVLKAHCSEDIDEVYSRLEKLTSLQIEARLSDIEQKTKSIFEKKERLNHEIVIFPRYKKIMEAFLKTDYDLSKCKELSCIALIFPKRFEEEMKSLQKKIEGKIKEKIDVYLSDFDARRVVSLVFYETRFSHAIDEELFKKGTQKAAIPQEYLARSFKESIGLIEAREKAITAQLGECDKNLEGLAKEHISFLHTAKLLLKDRLDGLMIQKNFVASKYTVALTGWLPEGRVERVKAALEDELGGSIILNNITDLVKRKEEIPILLDNPASIRPFEAMLSLLQPPKYGTLDPTRLLAVFFPIFFGLIVGDAGYGLVLLCLSLLLKRMKKAFVREISKLISYVAVSSIVFGILFAEFFGGLGSKVLGMYPILMDREKEIIPFLILAVSIGAFHILLGLVLGIIEAVRQKHRREAFEKGGIILSLFGLFLLVAALSNILPKGFFVPSVALLIASLPILIFAKGFIGPLEAVSAVANILSYARIMALGLAGVMMAHVANTLGGLIENVVLGIIVATLIHMLNLILSIFSPTIQSLRLHYVEFFSKFYEPGGKRYRPFRKGGETICTP